MIHQSALLAAASLIGVLLLARLAARMIRRCPWAARAGMSRELALRETIAIDPRRRLHLVACGDRKIILLTGGGHDLVVGWVPEK